MQYIVRYVHLEGMHSCYSVTSGTKVSIFLDVPLQQVLQYKQGEPLNCDDCDECGTDRNGYRVLIYPINLKPKV